MAEKKVLHHCENYCNSNLHAPHCNIKDHKKTCPGSFSGFSALLAWQAPVASSLLHQGTLDLSSPSFSLSWSSSSLEMITFTFSSTPKDFNCSLYDTRKPIDIIVSKISKRKLLPAPAQLDVLEQTFSYWSCPFQEMLVLQTQHCGNRGGISLSLRNFWLKQEMVCVTHITSVVDACPV